MLHLETIEPVKDIAAMKVNAITNRHVPCRCDGDDAADGRDGNGWRLHMDGLNRWLQRGVCGIIYANSNLEEIQRSL